ncbi:LPXTG cell wall anchor domain-containing protein [Streptomyces sp. NPDC046374]|uniref:LPXTG cell wall anchor domain-containing protein n=1 Tax=unclassified Streptomyces TaxID=2593676 RepID=UPI0033D61A51
MKIRRTMAAAAAMAVVAPLALLSARVAFADETTSPSPTETLSESASDTASPTETTSELPSDTPSASDTATSEAPTDTASPSTTEGETDEPEPTDSAEPSKDPTDPDTPYCEDLDEDFNADEVSAYFKGLPGKIVAGDGFHSFKLVITNESGTTLDGGVAFYAEIENYEVDDLAKYLSPYADLEFKNTETGTWERIGNDEFAGDYFFYVDQLKAGESKTMDLRVGIDAKAPAGDVYTFGYGGYLSNVDGHECIAEGGAQYDFEVLEPGSENPDPGSATPSDNGSKNLADTGADSALPTIGLLGGVALVAGAGALFAVRRRKAGVHS